MDSPIEKITDPSFTSSAKGLMTLFGIGLTHMVIGVNMDDVKITIPWLPTINFEHPDRLIYLYWALVFYTLYRYLLHNKIILSKYYFDSLHRTLELGMRGENFVSDYIFYPDQPYIVRRKDDREPYKIIIDPVSDSKKESSFIFTFEFNENYTLKNITCWINETVDTSSLKLKNQKIDSMWGFKPYERENNLIKQTTKIKSIKLKIRLHNLILRDYLENLIHNKDIFDTTVPVVLNIFLFIFWISHSI